MNTPTADAAHWADLQERTFGFGIAILGIVYRWFGRLPFRLCLFPVVLFYWLTGATARRASRDYLRRIQAAHHVFAREPGRIASLRHFIRFAETLLVKTLAASGRYPLDRLVIDGEQAIIEAIAAGQGGVIVTAHIGCLELIQSSASLREGLRITILVHTAHAERFGRILQRHGTGAHVRLLQVTEFSAPTAMMLADRVAAGEWIAIAGDRVPVSGDRVLPVSFLGQPAPFPAGPWLLASLLRCPVYLMACLRSGEGYRARVDKLADRIELPRAQRDQAMTEYAARFVLWIEERLRESPLDWFNFYAFWDQASRGVRHAG